MQKKILNLFWREAWRYPYRLCLAFFNVAATILVGFFIGPYIISQFLEKLQNGEVFSLSANIGLLLVYLIASIYGEVIGWRINLFLIWTFEVKAERNLHNRIFAHLTNQSINFHANRFGGSLVSQSNKLVSSFERFWDTILFQLTPSIVSIVAASVILSFVFWQYALFLAVLSLIFIIVIFLGSKFLAKLHTVEAQASTKQTGQLADAMTNIMAIKSHGHEKFEQKRYAALSEEWANRSFASMWGFLKVSTVYSALTVILNVTALSAAIWAADHTAISIATVYLCVTYTFTVARQLWEMNNIMRNYNRVIGDAHDMTEILEIVTEVPDTNNPEHVEIKDGSIDFIDVNYTHAESSEDTELFEQLNLSIEAGEKIGLVGPSGSGKTTLTKLLLRFMDIDNGIITIDGQNIADIKQSELRQHIAYVPQEPVLFHRSLMDNIRYGNLNASDAEVKKAAKLANADEFIGQLPKGYETLVGERGVKLSGGQRQRVAIARAMLKDAPILVLDEATSALDSESEALIQDALWKLMEGRTAIVIAHRLSTIQKMDRIVVLENGAIVEQGTHKQLLSKNGTYAKLWAHQSGGFIED
jgi:ATP-binding cassette, subfamily B, bacterial